MAIQGKKINELDSISTVTDATVFPAVRVEGSTPSSTATKVSISQLKENLQEDIYTKEQVDTLVGKKQDTLTAGNNITIEEDSDENLVISANVDSLPSQTGQAGKFLTTDGSEASWTKVNSFPTLVWYTSADWTLSQDGLTLTIADTSSANLVKVYKNGLLLEPTEDYTINGTTLTLVEALVNTDKICLEVF